jgi:hypothetical protein
MRIKRHTAPVSNDPRYRYLPLTRGLNSLVPVELFDVLNADPWSAVKHGNTYYARRHVPRNGKQGTVYLHNEVARLLGWIVPDGHMIDHANGDGLRNIPDNLRVTTNQRNQRNSRRKQKSGFTGVYFQNQVERWQAGVTVNGQLIGLGLYDDPADASRARDLAATLIDGGFWKLNQPLPFRIDDVIENVHRQLTKHGHICPPWHLLTADQLPIEEVA